MGREKNMELEIALREDSPQRLLFRACLPAFQTLFNQPLQISPNVLLQ